MGNGTLPAELSNDDPRGFAWGVWRDRTPKLIARIRDTHPYGPERRRALDGLLTEVLSGVLRPLPPEAHDHDDWAAWGAGLFGTPWLNAPFLWSESYFFRLLLHAVGYFTPGPWHRVDPFEHQKTGELRDPTLEPALRALDDLPELPVGERGKVNLAAALWGNRADLVFRIGRTGGAGAGDSGELVADESAAFWESLGPEVVLVADNAGRELLADLILIDHLLEHRQVATATLHVKPHPYYISDATTGDVVGCLRRLGETRGEASQIARRLWTAMTGGRLRPYTHDFYCAPWDYRRLPADLAAEFARASLTIVKGDLNYRRLVGDRDWPPSTPFREAAGYFPGPVVALRTLKSDALTGVAPATLRDLDGTGASWRTDGTHGLIQALTP